MAVDSILRTYADASVREDVVLNAIEYLTANEQSVFNMLGKTIAIAPVHSFLTDTYATAGSLAVGEVEDFAASSLTTPSRLTNIVQQVARNFKVGKMQQAIQHYQGENELQRQTNKALKDWGNAAEYDLLLSTLVSGQSGTTAKMSGIIQAISKSTNYTSHNSGTVFSATILDSLMVNCWTNSNGDVATELFVGGIIRRQIDGFIQKSNVVVNAPGVSTIVRTVSSYETSMGTLNIRKHRYVQQGATGRILAINPDKLKVAFLQKPYVMTDLAKSGPYDNYAVVGSFTLETRNQDSNFYADGFNLAV
jgi:hypothetical protein